MSETSVFTLVEHLLAVIIRSIWTNDWKSLVVVVEKRVESMELPDSLLEVLALDKPSNVVVVACWDNYGRVEDWGESYVDRVGEESCIDRVGDESCMDKVGDKQ